MKRIAPAAICLVAALTGWAFAASASAATPSWYYCGKAPKAGNAFTGNYFEKTCEASSETQGGGKYELYAGVGKGKVFKGSGSSTTLEVSSTLGSVPVECDSSAETGKPAVPNLETGVTFTFKKCEALGSKDCNTASAKPGEVVISGLKGTLSEIAKTSEVSVKLESEAHPGSEGQIATFTCEGMTATIKGSMTARQRSDVNVVSKEFETAELAAEPHANSQSIDNKGEALMVRTETEGGEESQPGSVLIGEKLEQKNGGDSKKREITPIKFVAAKSGTVEHIFFETAYKYKIAETGEGEATSLVLGIEEPGANGKPGKVLGEGTYHGEPGENKVVSVGGLHVPIVKGNTYYLDFLPLGGGISYWYYKTETIIYSVNHNQLTEGMPENYEWRTEAHEAPIGEWATGS